MPLRPAPSFVLPEDLVETVMEDGGTSFVIRSRAALTDAEARQAIERFRPRYAKTPHLFTHPDGTVRFFA